MRTFLIWLKPHLSWRKFLLSYSKTLSSLSCIFISYHLVSNTTSWWPLPCRRPHQAIPVVGDRISYMCNLLISSQMHSFLSPLIKTDQLTYNLRLYCTVIGKVNWGYQNLWFSTPLPDLCRRRIHLHRLKCSAWIMLGISRVSRSWKFILPSS